MIDKLVKAEEYYEIKKFWEIQSNESIKKDEKTFERYSKLTKVYQFNYLGSIITQSVCVRNKQ